MVAGELEAGALIRRSRERAGLTQAELARRLGTTQSAVARLERPGSNPRVDTLERALLATGRSLSIGSTRPKSSIDEGQIIERLKLSPAERLATFQMSSRNMRRLLEKASRPHVSSA
jgi:transcriptional regulator with XRE-family HTH domain